MVPELEQELMVLESVLIVPERAQMEQMIACPLATSDRTNSRRELEICTAEVCVRSICPLRHH